MASKTTYVANSTPFERNTEDPEFCSCYESLQPYEFKIPVYALQPNSPHSVRCLSALKELSRVIPMRQRPGQRYRPLQTAWLRGEGFKYNVGWHHHSEPGQAQRTLGSADTARSDHRLALGVHGLADELAVTLHTDSTGGLGPAMVISLPLALPSRAEAGQGYRPARRPQGRQQTGRGSCALRGAGAHSCARAGWGRRK